MFAIYKVIVMLCYKISNRLFKTVTYPIARRMIQESHPSTSPRTIRYANLFETYIYKGYFTK